ncbi:MAG: 6-carboxytetrahydropterin synthase [Gammaproteobacteria bacterium]
MNRVPAMYRVSKSVSFCYGHRLLNYEGKCAHLHGHNARAVITLESEELDVLGMVEDFSRVKQLVWDWLDAEIDHTLLLHRDDPVLPVLQAAGERVRVTEFNPTAENIARMIFDHVAAEGYPVVDVTLWETETSYASYRRTD